MYIDYHSHPLARHKSSQCHVDTFDNGDIRFVSYKTTVVYYSKSLDFLYCTGTYSQTTRKQIGWFLNEYFPSIIYQDMKRCYEQGLTVDRNGMNERKLTEHEKENMEIIGRFSCSNLYPSDFEE